MENNQLKSNNPCPACGGSGQLSSFKGESRFLLTVEECPLCCGCGLLLDEEQDALQQKKKQTLPLDGCRNGRYALDGP